MSAASTDATPPARRRSGGILAHPEDIHCVIYHVVVLVCYAVAFWIWHHPEAAGIERTWDLVAFVAAAGFLLGWISGVDVGVNFHNHTHRRIFKKRRWNDWFGRFWTFSGGWPSFFWNHAHVVVHHSNVLRDSDWTLPRRRADGRFENLYLYVFLHWPWRYIQPLWTDFTTGRGGARVGRRALKEFEIFLALWSIPFFIDWRMALCLWVLPHWVGNAVTMASGMYVQHAGGVAKSEAEPFAHSNCFLSPFFNMTMFNIGYHIEHHDNPHVHWSALPALHEAMKDKYKEHGAHVVPYGYYRAASIVSAISKRGRGYDEFVRDQAAEFADGWVPVEERVRDRSRDFVLQPGVRQSAQAQSVAERSTVAKSAPARS